MKTCVRIRARVLCSVCLAGLAGMGGVVLGANTWKGAGGGGLITATDVNDAANWDDSAVPGSNNPDDALFLLTSTSATRADLTIPAGGTFAPDGKLEMYDSQSLTTKITLKKALDLNTLKLRFSGTSGQQANRFFVDPGLTLNLSGSQPLDLTLGFTAWSALTLGTAGADSANTVNLTGSSVTFGTMQGSGINSNCDGDDGTSRIAGGAATSTAGSGPSLNFTAVGGTVHIASAGRRRAGTLSVGLLNLGVRSDQTWTCDATGFITRLNVNNAPGAGLPGPYVIDSLDGAPLNNLDQLNIRLGHIQCNDITKTEALRIWPGEYGSLNWTGGSTTFRTRWLRFVGNVVLKAAAVTPGAMAAALDPVVTDYGLIVEGCTGTTSGSAKNLSLDGYSLSIVKGLLLTDSRVGNTNNVNLRGTACIVADGTGLAQTVTVGGDLKVWSVNQHSANRSTFTPPSSPNIATPFVCLNGGSNGITLNLGGSFIVNTLPWENGTGQNLRYSTVTMTGGAAGSPKTWEVGDKASQTGLALKTFAVATFNVGDGTTGAYTALTNAYLNGNPIAIGGDPAVAKVGEKLIVGTLNVKTDSTLNANAQPVEVNTALTVASTAILDLNSGLTLAVGDRVPGFVGIGNQTTTWSSYAGRVVDSSVAGALFTPVLHTDGNTYWARAAGGGTTLIIR